MDVPMCSKCSRVRSHRRPGAGAVVSGMWCVIVSMAVLLSGCGSSETLLSTLLGSVGGGEAGVETDPGPIDLSDEVAASCDTSYHQADYGFGFDLDVLAVEAAGQTLSADALFAGAWSFSVNGTEVVVSAEVNSTSFPAELALIVATANADITLAGGTVASTFDLIVSNGDEAIQTNYVLDGLLVYRVDVVKNERRYTVAASASEADITQSIDNAMIAAVASICVD